jgi:hypothetical protein
MTASSSGLALEIGKEYPPADEQEAIKGLRDFTERTMVAKSHDPTMRDVHPKSHGYVSAEFSVVADLPESLRAGVFANPRSYQAWIRFSNGSSDRTKDAKKDFLPDTSGDIRGMAIKLVDVEGDFVAPGFNHAGEQDFILMNAPRFFIKNVSDYMVFFGFMRALKQGIKDGKVTLDSQGKPVSMPDELKGAASQIAYARKIMDEIKLLPTPSPLEIPYWSATPFRLGAHAMKFSVVPQQTGLPFDFSRSVDHQNYLREAIASHLSEREAVFDFCVQIQTDADTMPIEDPTVVWDESVSVPVKVANIRIPVQDINSPERLKQDEAQSFSPWHSLAAHQPLGGVNRARKMYADLARARNAMNQSTSPAAS